MLIFRLLFLYNNIQRYKIIEAYNENEILAFAERESTKGLKIGDIVYMWLTKPISNLMDNHHFLV